MPDKPKVLIIADRPNWAYHQIQLFIKNNFSSRFDIYTDFVSFNLNSKKKKFGSPGTWIQNKINEFRFRKISKTRTYDVAIFLGVYFPDFMQINFSANKIIKGIYTDGFPPQSLKHSNKDISINDFKNEYLTNTDLIVCGSELICSFYKAIFPNTIYANMAYEESFFPGKKNITKNSSTKIIIGWTGDPSREFKGYHSIIEPAISKAKKIRPEIEFITRFKGPIKTLPDFYRQVDFVLIASDKDAGPSLFVEAGMMNVPSISTRIGLPNEVIQDGVNGLFVERNIEAFVDAIIKIYDDRDLLYNMSLRIRNDIHNQLGKEICIERWNSVFDAIGF